MPQHPLAPPCGRILMLTLGQPAEAFRRALLASGDDYRWMTAEDSPGAGSTDWTPEVVVVLSDLLRVREQCRGWYDALPMLVQRWHATLVLTLLDTEPVPGDDRLLEVAADVLAHPESAALVRARIGILMRMRQLQRETQAATARLATMAHALRTPVQGMMMYLESMLEAAQQGDASEAASDVRACQAIAQQMSHLIQQCSRGDTTAVA